MKKILIVSYFYPPCNLTAAQRIKGWTDYLFENGFYPIVVTRNWDININKPEDVLKSSGNEIDIKKTDTHEVHYLPYKASFRDNVFTKNKGSRFQKLSRPLTFVNLVMENYRVNSIAHSNLYEHSRELLKKETDVSAIIISGNPFNQFFFGYKLNKEFGIPWIADYRDDWNTSEIYKLNNLFIRKLQNKSELKWVNSAACITSVSPFYVKKISDFTGVQGEVILNGFEIEKPNCQTDDSLFNITYNGSLYHTQPIEPLLRVINKLILEGYKEIRFHFPGLAYDKVQKERVLKQTSEIAEHINITVRISKEKVIQLQCRSDLLVLISHTNIKGIPSSKLYEYIGLEKPILLYPNDQDIMAATLKDTNLGIICTNEDKIYSHLKKMLDDKRSKIQTILTPYHQKINCYSRKEQTKKLALILRKISTNEG